MNVQVFFRLDRVLMDQPDVAMPVLQHFLSKGSVTKNTQTYEAALCQAFGIDKQPDWPAAALSWLGEGNVPGKDFWMYADPVHLQLQRDHFTLGLPAPLPMSDIEAETLCDSLNQHFREDGLSFEVGNSGRWYLRLTAPSNIAASFPGEAAGRDVRDYLPKGKDAERWRGVLNEIQMLLHEHPINRAREEQGLLAINSLWLSGAGCLPAETHDSFRVVMARHPLARGLARWSGREALPLPAEFFLPDEQNVLLVLEDAEEDLAQWLKHMRVWLQTRKVKHLALDIFVHDRHLRVALKPRDLFKFWRKPQPLMAYFSW